MRRREFLEIAYGVFLRFNAFNYFFKTFVFSSTRASARIISSSLSFCFPATASSRTLCCFSSCAWSLRIASLLTPPPPRNFCVSVTSYLVQVSAVQIYSFAGLARNPVGMHWERRSRPWSKEFFLCSQFSRESDKSPSKLAISSS
ncbi:uncharacterized protein BDZ99DRAFT_263407 [Mytilinidion resinicola]|uniref:Uncharacterized protein n=1 Tax=Mytilinidion resinicola TaxID=574789 RepID=A0A6A6YTY3_9PEZI|nr:uncharacterized protein BDZ99DRAFT_263407 [Mytilinidion resinicola]KAF2812241.1 hypothetical protein BDZ99DRAFT_263407 [Mytilinidion resinicola]